MAAKDKDCRAQIREASSCRRHYGIFADAVIGCRQRAAVGVFWNPATNKLEIEYEAEEQSAVLKVEEV